jgi:DNA-binding LytR/AlgR family response regulator
VQGFELNATDYLLKPVTFDRFLKAVNKATVQLAATVMPQPLPAGAESRVPENIFLKEGSRFIRLALSDILYVEGLKDYVRIQTCSQGEIVSLQRLKDMEEQLPATRFIRIHNSYIINIEQANRLYRQKVEIGAKSIPVGETYRQRFLDFLRQHNIHL